MFSSGSSFSWDDDNDDDGDDGNDANDSNEDGDHNGTAPIKGGVGEASNTDVVVVMIVNCIGIAIVIAVYSRIICKNVMKDGSNDDDGDNNNENSMVFFLPQYVYN